MNSDTKTQTDWERERESAKEIEIAVSERDETSYLLRSEANREHLLNAIRGVENQI